MFRLRRYLEFLKLEVNKGPRYVEWTKVICTESADAVIYSPFITGRVS